LIRLFYEKRATYFVITILSLLGVKAGSRAFTKAIIQKNSLDKALFSTLLFTIGLPNANKLKLQAPCIAQRKELQTS
jgi:hypothetical protein